MKLAHLILFLVLAARPAGADSSTPFALYADGAVVVPVFVDGVGPLPFLLDTGAARTAVVEGLVDRLALRAVARTLAVTLSGEIWRPVVRIGRLAVGPVTAEQLLVSVIPAPPAHHTGTAVFGILGQDVLSTYNYTIDYRRRELRWHDQPGLGADEAGIELALRREEGRLLVELPQDGGRTLRLVPDSGSNALVIFERRGRLPVPARDRGEQLALGGLAAARRVDVANVRLQIGSFTLRDQPAAIDRRPAPDVRDDDGLLPLHIFRSVSFDGRGDRLVVRPR